MSRINKRSGDIDFLSIAEGGTGASSMAAFKTNNNILPKNSPKAVILGPGGAFPTSAQFTGDIAGKPILTGSFEGIPNQTLTYTISNFDSFTNYTVSSTNGAISIVDDVITFVPGNNTSGNIYFTVNNNSYTVAISSLNPTRPTIQATGLKTGANAARINIQGTGFQSPANATMASMSVQISTTSDFAATIGTSNAGVNPTIDVASAGVVYIRAKFIDSASRESAWSSVVTLNIASLSTSIATPTLTIVANKTASGAVFKVTGSAFSESSGKTHKSTVYQVAEDNAFASILFNETDPTNLINKTINIGSVKTTYYVRAKYISSSDGESGWSQGYGFNYGDLKNSAPGLEDAVIYATGSYANTKGKFGYSVAISDDGNTLIIGQPEYENSGSSGYCGIVFIFEKNGSVWENKFTLQGKVNYTYDAWDQIQSRVAEGLGRYVEISGDGSTVFFSADMATGFNSMYQQNTYNCYKKVNGVWTLKATLGNSSNGTKQVLKSSYNGNIVITTGSNYLYHYKHDGTNYSPTELYGKLPDTNYIIVTTLGISDDGTRIFSGGSNIPGYSYYSRLRIIRDNGDTTYTLEAEFFPDVNSNSNTTFGTIIANNTAGDHAAVYDTATNEIFVYVRSGTTWTRFTKFSPTVATTSLSQYKLCISQDGTIISLGQPSSNKVVFYYKNATTYVEGSSVTPSIAGNIKFGDVIEVTPDMKHMVVGAYDYNANQGAVFSFK